MARATQTTTPTIMAKCIKTTTIIIWYYRKIKTKKNTFHNSTKHSSVIKMIIQANEYKENYGILNVRNLHRFQAVQRK